MFVSFVLFVVEYTRPRHVYASVDMAPGRQVRGHEDQPISVLSSLPGLASFLALVRSAAFSRNQKDVRIRGRSS
jgi:hypothetical protein